MDINGPNPWQYGLAALTTAGPSASVVVEGLGMPVEGELVDVAEDRGLLIEQHDPGTESGTVVWVPLDRVVSVSVPYRRRDVAAERRERVEADPVLLAQVRALAAAHAARTRQTGRRTFQGLTLQDAVSEIEGYSHQDIAVALSILAERGDVPTDDG